MAERCAAESAAAIGMAGKTQRSGENDFDALTRRHDLTGNAEAHGVTEQVAHCASRRFDRRLAERRLAEAARIEPGAMHAGDGPRDR